MEALVLENLIHNHRPTTLRIGAESVEVKYLGSHNARDVSKSDTIEVLKENIKNFELFRGKKAFCLRIRYTTSDTEKNVICDIHNVHESFIPRLRTALSSNYGLTLPIQELETLLTTQGNLIFTNGTLSLQSEREVFNIPKEAIRGIIEVENDLQLDLGDTEIVFNTTSEVSAFLHDRQSEEICIINGLNCINPRSKSCLVFFPTHFVLKGSSYDHVVPYDTIHELFFLKNDVSYYFVIRLNSPVIQGQTRYEYLVFLLSDKDLEVATKDSRLKEYYSGKQHDVVLEIVERLSRIKAQESDRFFKCTSKVFEGHLYLLSGSLLFLPKSISIPLDEITHVEFSRINVSAAQAKTFDMSIYSTKIYNFTGIPKDAFSQIELYFNKNNIKMVSEVIEDSYSGESATDEDDGSDLSDMIASEED